MGLHFGTHHECSFLEQQLNQSADSYEILPTMALGAFQLKH